MYWKYGYGVLAIEQTRDKSSEILQKYDEGRLTWSEFFFPWR